VNRVQLRQLAEDRLLDAERLLTGGRWAGAYYLAGYAVECGLKACIMAHVEATGAIFQDRKYQISAGRMTSKTCLHWRTWSRH
jgi:hypothetical protein